MESNEQRKEAPEKLCMQVYDKFIYLSLDSSPTGYMQSDSASIYAIQLLRIGCLYMEFADTIREGDGVQVARCWRYFLPVFRASRSSNYACEAFHFLYQHLSPTLSNQLIWGWFLNLHGLPGRLICIWSLLILWQKMQ